METPAFWEVAAALFGLLLIWVYAWAFLGESAVGRLERWAQATGWRIVSSEVRLIRTGPFPSMRGGNQVVRAVVQDGKGNLRAGFFRLTAGSEAVDVRWDS